MKQVLDGMRVIDWTVFQVGAGAGAKLGDLGADVIKIEERGRGDPIRGSASWWGVSLVLPGGRQAIFEDANRNKRGLAVDLRKEKGKQIIYRLIEKSDVFITNHRPSSAKRLGLDYETLRRYNPKLIYGSASGFGPLGPDSDAPGMAMQANARSGMMFSTSIENDDIPVMDMSAIADRIGAISLADAVLAALLARERFGIGQHVEVSQLGSMIDLQAPLLISHLLTGRDFPRQRRNSPPNPLVNFYKCKDERWIAIQLGAQDKLWSGFCRALEMPELEHDSQFGTFDKRGTNNKELVALLDRVFATKASDEWQKRFKMEDVPFAVVKRLRDLADDPQVRENEYIIDWDHPALGKVKFMGFPVRFSETPASVRMPAPELGQHTEEVLLHVCGYSWEEISQLQKEEVI
ncbi:MAG: CoA transferase [Chloroflexi bacterium]|nr:CoA transferase [Chloroflexota bacterium]